MPTLPAFSSFGPQPNLSQAYIGGANIQLEEEKIAQQAMQHAEQIKLEHEKLQQSAMANQMEMQARERINNAEMLQKQQQAEIESAYKTNLMALKQQELQDEAIKAMLVHTQATNTLAETSRHNKAQEDIGAQRNVNYAAKTAQLAKLPGGMSFDPEEAPLKGSKENRTWTRVGKDSIQVFTPGADPNAPATAILGPEGQRLGVYRSGKNIITEHPILSYEQSKDALTRFEKRNELLMPEITGFRKPSEKRKQDIEDLQEEYKKLKAALEASQQAQQAPTAATLPPGQQRTNTSGIRIIQNNAPAPR